MACVKGPLFRLNFLLKFACWALNAYGAGSPLGNTHVPSAPGAGSGRPLLLGRMFHVKHSGLVGTVSRPPRVSDRRSAQTLIWAMSVFHEERVAPRDSPRVRAARAEQVHTVGQRRRSRHVPDPPRLPDGPPRNIRVDYLHRSNWFGTKIAGPGSLSRSPEVSQPPFVSPVPRPRFRKRPGRSDDCERQHQDSHNPVTYLPGVTPSHRTLNCCAEILH
jgi:hypothetical protein